MIQGYVGDSGLPRNPQSVVAKVANLTSRAVWAAQVGLRCQGVECIDVRGG